MIRLAEQVLDRLRDRGVSLAVAESLTGGLLAAQIVAVPGASDCFRGAVVAYATDLKVQLLGVDPALLADRGPVDEAVATAMARGVRERLGADLAMATTGVAGPGPQDGRAAGTVFLALAVRDGDTCRSLRLAGDRGAVRDGTVRAALEFLIEFLDGREQG